MSTAEDFLLIATNPDTGKAMIDWPQSDPVFGGAFLLDLVAAGRLDLDGHGRNARVFVANPTPVDDPVVEKAFARIRTKGRQAPKNAVNTMGRQSRKRLYAALVANGTLRRRPAKALGVFPITRHKIINTARRDDLRARIRASLLHNQPADAETGPLIGLLSAGELTKIIVDKPDRKLAKARAKVLAEGDWAGEGVRKAIRASQAAMTAAIAAGASVSSAGS